MLKQRSNSKETLKGKHSIVIRACNGIIVVIASIVSKVSIYQ